MIKSKFKTENQTFILVDEHDCILRYFSPCDPKLLPFMVDSFIENNKLDTSKLDCYLIVKVSK